MKKRRFKMIVIILLAVLLILWNRREPGRKRIMTFPSMMGFKRPITLFPVMMAMCFMLSSSRILFLPTVMSSFPMAIRIIVSGR